MPLLGKNSERFCNMEIALGNFTSHLNFIKESKGEEIRGKVTFKMGWREKSCGNKDK